jgi:hypothetical protein
MLKPIARLIMMAGLRKERPAEKKFLSWDKIRTMALIIGSGEKVNKSQIDKFVDTSGKHVDVYYVELASAKPSFGDWRCLLRSHRNFLRLPVKRVQEDLRSKKYDAVLNACDGTYLFPAAVAALIPAPLKCAVSDLLGYANLEVSRKKSQDLPEYLEEVKKYLMMIRT